MVEQFKSVRYLHVMRCYNAAADKLATEALEAKAGRLVHDAEQVEKFRELNCIQEKLYADTSSANSAGEQPVVSATTRSQARRVRFNDQLLEEPTTIDKPGGQRVQDVQPAGAYYKADEGEEYEAIPRRPENTRASEHTAASSRRRKAPSAEDVDPVAVQTERRERISTAQDEEARWSDLKRYLRGELDELTCRRVNNAGKVADRIVLSEDGILYYVVRRQEERSSQDEDLKLRIVIPSTLVDEILLSCHDFI